MIIIPKFASDKIIDEKTRKFSGKIFRKHTDHFKKNKAKEEAKRLKKKGYNARIFHVQFKKNVFNKDFYRVYKRKT